ncbi:MAG: helix-turn-helix domain-containing protein [Candidatus Binataceae bacterium]
MVNSMSILEEIEQLIGVDAAEKFVTDFAGRRVYVPHVPAPDDLITRSIGFSAAVKLASLFAGYRMEVPARANRRDQIVALRASGYTVPKIARELRCTARRVYQVLAEMRQTQRNVF